MTRDHNVSAGPDPNTVTWIPNDTANWTDYNGMMPYLDFDLSSDVNDDAVVDEVTRYLAGMGIAARQDDATSADEFLHGDLIRSTVATTDDTGAVNDTLSYTAFGQLVTSSGIGGELPAAFPRYAYAGGWGYESDLLVLDGAPATESIVLHHVGARWYQPDTGRFIMRDPIGIAGGFNVYVYAGNMPTIGVDPNGKFWGIIGRAVTWIGSKIGPPIARRIGPPIAKAIIGSCLYFAGPGAAAVQKAPTVIRRMMPFILRRTMPRPTWFPPPLNPYRPPWPPKPRLPFPF